MKFLCFVDAAVVAHKWAYKKYFGAGAAVVVAVVVAAVDGL